MEIPGGGTEGYHVLRVRQPVKNVLIIHPRPRYLNFVFHVYTSGSGWLTWTKSRARSFFRLYSGYRKYTFGKCVSLLVMVTD